MKLFIHYDNNMSKKEIFKAKYHKCGEASSNLIHACLVLEGGALRGIYTQGVLDFLMEHDINCDCVIGVSAGVLNALTYLSGQIGRSAYVCFKYRFDSRYFGFKAFRKNKGFVGFDFLFHESRKYYPFDEERFFNPSRELIATATNIISGESHYFSKNKLHNDFFKAAQASSSLALISKEVKIGNSLYLDGGYSDKIPYKKAFELGYDKVIVVKTRDATYRKEEKEIGFLLKKKFKNYPKFKELMNKSAFLANSQYDEVEKLYKEGKIFLIEPSSPVNVSFSEKNIKSLVENYDKGYLDASNSFDKLKEYLDR